MTQNRDLRATVGFKTDLASVNTAAAAPVKVAAGFATATDAVAAFGAEIVKRNPQLAALASQEAAAQAATQKLAQTQSLVASSAAQTTSALTAQRAPVQDLTNLYAALDSQAKQAATSTAAVGSSSGGGSLRSGFGTIRSFGSAAGTLSGTTAGSQIAAIAGLGSELGVVGLVAAGAAAAVRVYSDSLEKSTERAKAFGDALAQAFLGTSTDIQEYIRSARAQINANTAVRDSLKELAATAPSQLNVTVDEVANSLNNLRQSLGIPLEVQRFGDAAISQEAYNAQIDEYNKKIQLGQIALDAYTQAFGNNLVATNDAVAAEERLADLREKIANAQTGFQSAELDAAIRTQSLTKDQREERIREIQSEIAIRDAYRETHELTEEALQANAVAVDKLRNEYVELAGVTTSTADLQAREKLQLDNAAKALQEVNKQRQLEADALERVEDIRQRLTDLETDTVLKRQNALDDYNTRIGELEGDAQDKRTEIAADGAEKRQEIDQEDAEKRADILKRFNTDYTNAVASRDALAAYKAKQTRDEELDKQDKAHQKQLDQLQKQLDKQLDTVQKSLDKQLRNIQQQYDKQQRSIDDAYDRQLRGLQRDLAEQNAAAENARRNQKVFQDNYNRLTEQATLTHEAIKYKTIYDYGEMTKVYLSNLWRDIAEGARQLSINQSLYRQFNDPNAPTGVAGLGGSFPTSSAGFPPLSDDRGNILRSQPALARLASLPSGLNLINAPTRLSSLPSGGNRNVTAIFAPTLNGARISAKEFDNMANKWFVGLRRAVS